MSRSSQSFAMTARYRRAARQTKRKAHLHGTIISHHPAIVSLFAPVNVQKFHDITAQHAVDEKEDTGIAFTRLKTVLLWLRTDFRIEIGGLPVLYYFHKSIIKREPPFPVRQLHGS